MPSPITAKIEQRPGLWASLIICAVTVLRLWFVGTGQLTLVQDETQYWDWTRHLQWTYYSKGPLIAWIIALWTNIFGNTELGVRFGSIFGSAVTQILLYVWLAKGWNRPRLGVVALLVFNTVILFAALGILMTTDNPFVLFWLACLVCLDMGSRADGNGRAPVWPFAVLALLFGLGVLAKYTMLGFPALAALYWLGLRIKGLSPKRFFTYLFLSCTTGVVLGFLPTLIWNLQHDFVGYKHVMYLIGAAGKQAKTLIRFDRFPDYFGSQVGLATPWWLAFMLIGGWRAVKRYFKPSPVAERPSDDPGTARNLLLAVFFWPVWGFFLLWSFHAKVLPNWATVSYVSGVVLAALAFDRFLDRSSRAWARRTIVGLAVGLFLVAHFFQYAPVPDNLNITHRVKGWRHLGQTVEAMRLDPAVFQDPDKVFIFSNLYDMTAALAFYVPGQPRTYCGWVDSRRMNQYDLWPGPTDKLGWDALYVLKDHEDAFPPDKDVRMMFKRIGDPVYLTTEYNGRPARKFTIIPCYGYNGYWPDQAELDKY